MSNHFAEGFSFECEWLREFGFIKCVDDVNLPP